VDEIAQTVKAQSRASTHLPEHRYQSGAPASSPPPTAAPWQVKRLRLHARFLAPTATCGETYEVLAAAPQLPGLAIIEGDQVVGSVDRHSLLATFARPVARDLYERRPITLLMDRAPLIVDPETSIHELSERIGRDKPSALMSGFIVATEGRFIGIGSVIEILKLQVAESHQRGIELEAARAEAVRADAAKSQFLANMSHELRTPLNAVIGFADIIQGEMFGKGEPAWRRYTDYAGDIGTSGRFLLDLISDILDLSKTAAGKIELREENTSLDDLFGAVERFFRERATAAGLRIEIHRPAHETILWADEVKLKQVLLNIVSNAIKFTPAGGRVTISATLIEDGRLAFSITDTGIGIAPEDIGRIFQPFTQIENSLARRHAGTGLGLPLARSFVELHGGSIEIRSRPGSGTEVTVLIPAERLQPDASIRAAG
jgi:two-component system cell cycle sensor histidine kinase PleC